MPIICIRQVAAPIAYRGESILDSALRAGVAYPHGCRSGECGSCKTRLHAGNVEMTGYAPGALSDEERSSGLILACRSRPASDVDLEWLQADAAPHPVRRLKARVADIRAVTHDITRIKLGLARGSLAFTAGQYAQLTFDFRLTRPYSMANRPDDPVLEFHVRHVPNGAASGYAAQTLKPGEAVRVEGPFGTAHLRETQDRSIGRPIILAAGGSGLAPMLSILRAILQRGGREPLHLYHGVRDACDLYGTEELVALGANSCFSYTPVLSAPSIPMPWRTGFVHAEIARDFSSLTDAVVYTAGPPPMVEAIESTVARLGVRSDDVHADAFFSATGPAAGGVGFRRRLANLFCRN